MSHVTGPCLGLGRHRVSGPGCRALGDRDRHPGKCRRRCPIPSHSIRRDRCTEHSALRASIQCAPDGLFVPSICTRLISERQGIVFKGAAAPANRILSGKNGASTSCRKDIECQSDETVVCVSLKPPINVNVNVNVRTSHDDINAPQGSSRCSHDIQSTLATCSQVGFGFGA